MMVVKQGRNASLCSLLCITCCETLWWNGFCFNWSEIYFYSITYLSNTQNLLVLIPNTKNIFEMFILLKWN